MDVETNGITQLHLKFETRTSLWFLIYTHGLALFKKRHQDISSMVCDDHINDFPILLNIPIYTKINIPLYIDKKKRDKLFFFPPSFGAAILDYVNHMTPDRDNMCCKRFIDLINIH